MFLCLGMFQFELELMDQMLGFDSGLTIASDAGIQVVYLRMEEEAIQMLIFKTVPVRERF